MISRNNLFHTFTVNIYKPISELKTGIQGPINIITIVYARKII